MTNKHDRTRWTIGLAIGLWAGLLVQAGWGQNLLGSAQVRYAVLEEGKEPQWQTALNFEKPGTYRVGVQFALSLGEPPLGRFFVLRAPVDVDGWTLNGEAVKPPLEGMRYRTLYQVPANLFKVGDNVLQTQWTINVVRLKETGALYPAAASFSAELRPQTEAELAIHTGPILGQVATDSFTVTCRTTLPAVVTLKVRDKTYNSPEGFMHAFKAEGLEAGKAYEYSLSAALPESRHRLTVGPYSVRTLPASGPLVFVATGDSRTNAQAWMRIAEAVVQAKPMFLLHSGDLVSAGRNDQEWNDHFWAPARDLCATVPLYPVMGNHEQAAPLFEKLFALPAEGRHWQQRIGPVLIVGIDGTSPKGQWALDGPDTQWLNKTLADSDARFIFVVSHYPAWSSSSHGADKMGNEVIFPLLEKHKVTAMIAGHDHCYERSEPGNGTTMLIAGGGGAPLYGAKPETNPHSKVFRKDYNYLIFRVEGDQCSMTAHTIDGQQIDTRTWKAR